MCCIVPKDILKVTFTSKETKDLHLAHVVINVMLGHVASKHWKKSVVNMIGAHQSMNCPNPVLKQVKMLSINLYYMA